MTWTKSENGVIDVPSIPARIRANRASESATNSSPYPIQSADTTVRRHLTQFQYML